MHVIATAGHVDHGKSTLLRMLTGMEPDRWAEERRRGLTIDLGFAWTTLTDGCTIAFVDVPGHERFVPNMLAGTGPVPAVMFVVAADDGWMPQSAEHAQALDALGVAHGLLVITRSDLANPAPAARQAQKALRGTSLADFPVVTVSGATGAGLDGLRVAVDELVHALPAADADGDVRLWVDRAFTIQGAGTVVTGTLRAGTLRTGDELSMHPGRTVTVRGIQSLGSAVDEATAVCRVAVNVRGVRPDEIRRGDALVTLGRWLHTDLLDARIAGVAPDDLPRHLMLHIGSASVPVRVRPLGRDSARLTLARPLPLRIGDRGALRDAGSHSVPAGVIVLDVRPPELTRRGAARARAAVLAQISDAPDGQGELHRRGLIRAGTLEAMGVEVPGNAWRAGDWLIDDTLRRSVSQRLVALVRRHEREYPLRDGMPSAAAVRELKLPAAELLDVVLAGSGVRVSEGSLYFGDAGLPDEVWAGVREIRKRLAAAPFAAPPADELRELGLAEKELAAAVRQGWLRKIAPGIYLLPDAADAAVQTLRELPAPFTLSQAKQALGTTRRVAVPLLEMLDRAGHTHRAGDGTRRVRLKPAGTGIPDGRAPAP